ncbi:hypothetical protein H1R20_g13729, partial [Candolleomyces eurysporus]
MSDSDADADGVPDIELLDYQALEGKDREQLKEIEAKVVVKIEPVLEIPESSDENQKLALEIGEPVKSDTFNLWSADGKMEKFKPRIHVEEDYIAWKEIFQAVEANYVDDGSGIRRPRSLADPESSMVHVCTEEKFNTMTAAQFQYLHSKKNLHVLGSHKTGVEFNEARLETLADLSHHVDIQDQSMPIIGGDGQMRV